jgi:NAD-dependent deacetylase
MMAKIVFLSGAGLSAPSGIRTFRDAGGLWEEYDVMEVCSTQGYEANPQKVHQFYDKRRQELEFKKPNSAHEMIARLKKEFPSQIAVITQNVDDLLERAGCEDVVHVHGTLTHLRCLDCGEVFYIGYKSQARVKCPTCKGLHVRHHVVMFGESAPLYAKMQEELNDAQLLVCIGTSGQVVNVAWMASWVEDSILNNIDKDEALDPYFKTCFTMSAIEAAPKIEAYCRDFLDKMRAKKDNND